MNLSISKDGFSSGQIGSKLWLCKELEKHICQVDNIWIYGGWYGLTSFLLRTRNVMNIGKIFSFDLDPNCEKIADTINENWVIDDWKFKAFTKDCNTIIPKPNEVDLIINTSTEHFNSRDWYWNIRPGTWIVLQGADMQHDDHVFKFNNLKHFCSTFPMTECLFSGHKEFVYPNWSFNRFMIIGIK